MRPRKAVQPLRGLFRRHLSPALSVSLPAVCSRLLSLDHQPRQRIDNPLPFRHPVTSELLPTHSSEPSSETDRGINDLRADGVFATHRLLPVSGLQSSSSERYTYL